MHDLSVHILDLIENSLHAGASLISISVEMDRAADLLQIRVADDGHGLSVPPERALCPFYTTNGRKRVGLGLSLFKGAVEQAGGQLSLSPSREGGLMVVASMGLTHVDRPPLGDIAETIGTMVLTNPSVDFRLSMGCGERRFSFQVSEFARSSHLDGASNVALGSAVFEVLRHELKFWKSFDPILSKDCLRNRKARSRCVAISNPDQGVNA